MRTLFEVCVSEKTIFVMRCYKGTVPNDVFRMGFGRVSGELLRVIELTIVCGRNQKIRKQTFRRFSHSYFCTYFFNRLRHYLRNKCE